LFPSSKGYSLTLNTRTLILFDTIPDDLKTQWEPAQLVKILSVAGDKWKSIVNRNGDRGAEWAQINNHHL
jgi:hypothetical protein